MQCPNCHHQVNTPDGRCIYCGTLLAGRSVDAAADAPAAGPTVPPPNPDLPDRKEKLIENMFEKARAQRKSSAKKSRTPLPPVENEPPPRVLSVDEIYNVLLGMKESFENGFSEYPVYQRMAADLLKQHLMSLTSEIRVRYTVHEIMETKLAEFIDGDMFSLLVYFAVSSVTKKPDITWKPKRKSWFFSR